MMIGFLDGITGVIFLLKSRQSVFVCGITLSEQQFSYSYIKVMKGILIKMQKINAFHTINYSEKIHEERTEYFLPDTAVGGL